VLRRARPNPVQPSTLATEIRFELAEPAWIALRLYDVAGRSVRTLVDGTFAAGEHLARWDGRDERGHRVAAGVYFYRLDADGRQAGPTQSTRRLVVLR
jgi:flagellar hook assembly protein FlgD